MNDHRDLVAGVITSTRQSPGNAPTSNASAAPSSNRHSSTPATPPTASSSSYPVNNNNNKRNSGIFSFLKWFRSTSKESVASSRDSPTSSLGSIPFGGSNSSLNSTGTAASFNFIPPAAYTPKTSDKCIHPGPETDTYKARLKQRDKVREKDKNITLRKKYNLFFNRDKGTKQKEKKPEVEEENRTNHKEDNCKSLPLMTKTKMSDDDKGHRRTNSDSSKGRKAGAYLHVKGKRKAPPPPQNEQKESSLSLRRKKRLAPPPPAAPTAEKVINALNTEDNVTMAAKQNGGAHSFEYADVDVIQNDCLKLDHGVLKPTKDQPVLKPQKSPLLGVATSLKSEIPVSPKPWYKRATSSQSKKRESKYEPVIPPFIVDNNNHKNFKLEKTEKDDKRKSNIMFLTNISELDREASEIIKNQANSKQKQPNEQPDYELPEMPEFMKPKAQEDVYDVQQPPSKRKSAKDLIAKFNAITSVTKVTVNSAFFNPSSDKNYFGKKKEVKEVKNVSGGKDVKKNGFGLYQGAAAGPGPLMKSETTTCILPVPQAKPQTPKLEKLERKSWMCPKCNLENDYWRIICHVCSTIKPYFDNFAASDSPTNSGNSKPLDDSNVKLTKNVNNSSSSSSNNSLNVLNVTNDKPAVTTTPVTSELPILMRSKTQISFGGNRGQRALGTTPSPVQNETTAETKREEKEKLKKMLIEMKNSLPKRKSHVVLQNRKSTIDEGPEIQQNKANSNKILAENDANLDLKDEKMMEVDQKIVQKEEEIKTQIKPSTSNDQKKESPYQLLRPKDFEDIYSEKIATNSTTQHLYANLPESQNPTPKELFFNVPKKLNELKQNLASGSGFQSTPNAADTLEINKLLRRLENAIAKGDLNDAAGYAKDLAHLKVNCSVIRQKQNFNELPNKANRFIVEMYVEDRLSHRGPFPIEVFNEQTVLELKQQVQREFEIPIEVQRWILGKELAGNDKTTLKELNVTQGCPIFLYLVAPTAKNTNEELKTPKVVNIEVKELNVDVKTSQTKEKSDNVAKPSNLPVPTTNLSSGISKLSSGQSGQSPSGFIRSEKSAFAVVPSEKGKVKNAAVGTSSGSNSPRIVGEHLKVHVMIKPKTNAETQIGEIAKAPPVSKLPLITKTTNSHLQSSSSSSSLTSTTIASTSSESKPSTTGLATAVKTSVIVQTAPTVLAATQKENKTPPKAEQEDFSEYDKTIRPPRVNKEAKQAHWICHVCTLVNNPTANICSVCATVRQKQENTNKPDNKLHYYELMNLDNSDLVPNCDAFECLVCLTEVKPKEGVTLRECLHQFCKMCLAHTIEFSDEAEVKCPYRDQDYSCDIALQDREIKALVSRQAYDQFLAKSVAQAENKMDKTFHCKTPDCTGWCVFEDNVNEFRCPICKKTNCLTCQAIHWGLNCRQYQEHMNNQSETDEDARQTREWLNEMVEKGEALACPACHVVMMKKWGCDWVRCSMCKTEICWVTRGLRWGPAGKGDTSGGCKCGVNGVKCHAKCNYCH
ncbi:LOW QUALITY PROTEIN: uncharacterized protein [Atheta coriaria]|uniref:LOW QUALITY PROTEIN: uncharacterized protein n=1 Tax=Dalotia coriaria TaxID=877792 RepID=UPI0031F38CDD